MLLERDGTIHRPPRRARPGEMRIFPLAIPGDEGYNEFCPGLPAEERDHMERKRSDLRREQRPWESKTQPSEQSSGAWSAHETGAVICPGFRTPVLPQGRRSAPSNTACGFFAPFSGRARPERRDFIAEHP